tara:strand:+ start:98 stop:1615 length:1518 start_codon:yes stop_codon:yes gene_type:complete
MGIDNVAIKTFNSTGSQSVCRANDADETKLIESEFLTKCTTEYMNGTGTSFIPGSMNLSALQASNPSEIFTLPNDVDAISEIILQMGIDDGANVSPTFLLDMIKKIEIKLGNLVIQTILPGDIYSRNLTEFGTAITTNTFQKLGNKKSSFGFGLLSDANKGADFSVSIPFTGRSTGVNKCFLQAGAVTNHLTIKVYYNKLVESVRLIQTLPTDVSTGLCVLNHSMTSTEKNFIAKNIINRPVNTSQSVVSGITSTAGPLTIDLSSININVSHILLSLNNRLFNSSGVAALSSDQSVIVPTGGTDAKYNLSGAVLGIDASGHGLLEDDQVYLQFTDANAANSGVYTVLSSNLLTNSFEVTAGSVTGNGNVKLIEATDTGTTWSPIADGVVTSGDLGVATGWLKAAELMLGNDRTGTIPGSCLTTDKLELFKLKSVTSDDIYILKLAGSAFSTAGIPFSRLNNRKLVIRFTKNFTISPYTSGLATINVTCCGTQIQSTVGGSISFSA